MIPLTAVSAAHETKRADELTTEEVRALGVPGTVVDVSDYYIIIFSIQHTIFICGYHDSRAAVAKGYCQRSHKNDVVFVDGQASEENTVVNISIHNRSSSMSP